MLFVSDVHDNADALRRVASLGEELAILGDLVNLNDYRTGHGAVARVVGIEFAQETAEARGRSDFERMRRLWTERFDSSERDIRAEIKDEIRRQYQEAARALEGGEGVVIHGNVDRPEMLRASLPSTFSYVHGQRLEREDMTLGFIGGGVETPLNVPGEIPDALMVELLESIGSVDVLCTHVPPAIPSLRRDVVTGKIERGSQPVYEYVKKSRPRFHIFGDVHQPQATTWRIGETRCFNAGYFRATGRFLRLHDGVVQVASVG